MDVIERRVVKKDIHSFLELIVNGYVPILATRDTSNIIFASIGDYLLVSLMVNAVHDNLESKLKKKRGDGP